MDEITSLVQFRDLIDTGYEIEFVLNNKHWLLEPDQKAPDFSERRTLACNDTDYIEKFNNTDEVLNHKINGEKLSNLWSKMREVYW